MRNAQRTLRPSPPVTEFDVRVQELDEGRRLGAVEVLLGILVVFPAAAAPVSAIAEAFVLTRPAFVDVGRARTTSQSSRRATSRSTSARTASPFLSRFQARLR